jgi:YggT family protein
MVWLVLANFIDLFATVFNALIIARIIMSLFASPTNRLYNGLINLTEPVLRPVRKVLPPRGGVDWSPTVTVIALYMLDTLVVALLTSS